jgi:hypothetical protein
LAHRECVQQVEGLQVHRNAVRQAGAKVLGLSCRSCRLVDLLSLNPNTRQPAALLSSSDRIPGELDRGGEEILWFAADYPDDRATPDWTGCRGLLTRKQIFGSVF